MTQGRIPTFEGLIDYIPRSPLISTNLLSRAIHYIRLLPITTCPLEMSISIHVNVNAKLVPFTS